MALPESYTLKPGSIGDYFDAIVKRNLPNGFRRDF